VIYGHCTPDGARDSILLRAINIALLAEWGLSVISFLVVQKTVSLPGRSKDCQKEKQDPKNLLHRGAQRRIFCFLTEIAFGVCDKEGALLSVD
jgi:hypothetical protein